MSGAASILAFINFRVITFSDEEGIKFQLTFLGSAAASGILSVSALQITDKRFSLKEHVLKLVCFTLGIVKGIAGQTRLKDYELVSRVRRFLRRLAGFGFMNIPE